MAVRAVRALPELLAVVVWLRLKFGLVGLSARRVR